MSQEEELTLRDFASIIRRRKQEFLTCWGAVFFIVVVYTFTRTPSYRAQALVKVRPPEEAAKSIDLGALNVSAGGTGFNVEELTSPQIFQELARRMAGETVLSPEQLNKQVQDISHRTNVDWSDRDQQLVMISMVAPVARMAAAQTNMLTQIIIEQVTLESNAKAKKQREFIESQLEEVQGRLRDSEDRLRRIQEKFGAHSIGGTLLSRLMELRSRRALLAQKYTSSYPELQQISTEMKEAERQLQELPSQEIDVTRVTREVHLNEEMFTLLTKRLEDARILEAARTAPITLIDSAIEPSVPESPNKRYNLFVGMVGGLLLGLVLVLIRQHFDTSITPEEIQSYLQLPVLATIPHIERRHRQSTHEGRVDRVPDPMGEGRSRLLTHFSPQSLHVEVHHLLRNNLMKNFAQNESLVFLFTSSVTGEGKSISAANFAIAAAQVGVRTLLVDVDLRKPMQHQLFHVRQEPGITNYFYSTPRWETCLIPGDQIRSESPELQTAINVGGLGNLTLMTSGKQPSNPVPFLGSDRFRQLIAAMRQRFPLIILDGAPALMFADCSIMAGQSNGVILLYRYGRTPREILRRTHTQLVSSGAKVLGVVANDIAQGGIAVSDNYYRLYENYERPYAPPAA